MDKSPSLSETQAHEALIEAQAVELRAREWLEACQAALRSEVGFAAHWHRLIGLAQEEVERAEKDVEEARAWLEEVSPAAGARGASRGSSCACRCDSSAEAQSRSERQPGPLAAKCDCLRICCPHCRREIELRVEG